uniref:Uncharacterized protein n=1 Tax=Anopheles atroparvus TaxID=41427 RepID=A0AAG5D225_ANOAO
MSRRNVGVGLLLAFATSLVGIACEKVRNIEYTTTATSTEDAAEYSAENVEVIFSNATVLHIEDGALEVITRDVFKLHPQLEHCRIAGGMVHSIDKDAFLAVKHLTALLLDRNSLATVPKAAFRALPHLVTLSISNNRLVELLADDFLSTGDLQWLSLSENFIAHVHPGAFDGLPRLTFLNMSWNHLTAPDGIQTLSRLNVLDFGYNYVKLLNYSHFEPLKDLRELSVRGNLLDGLPSGAFASLAELRRLDLGDNFLKSLPQRAFAANVKLEELTLEGNVLERLPEELFRGLTHLRTLNVQNNRLTALPGGTFRDQATFERLALAGNRLVQLEQNVLRSADVLLQNNHIQVLKRASAANASYVRNVFLYGNEIAAIEQDALEHLPGLEMLYVDYNRIEELPPMLFHASHRLQHASFSRNALTVLRTNTFAGLAHLHAVDLSYNRLSVIESAAFHGSPVEYLNLNGNRLRVLDDGAFLGTRLLYLHVAANEITSFHPQPSGVLRNLVELTVNGNRIASLQPLCSGLFPQVAVVDLRNNSLTSTGASCMGHLPRHESEVVAYDLALNGYSQVPSLPGRILSIDLSGNHLTGFQENQFRWYQHTETVLLRDTSIAKLEAADFAFLVQLKRVEIGSKALTSIEEDTFHLRKLHHLEINDSPLKELPNRLLAGQTNLSLVSFAQNKLSFLPSDFFRDCHRLEDINLSFNEFEVVDSTWFMQLEHLHAVNLEGNRIARLPTDLFMPEQSLDTFSVAGNRITSIAGASFLAEVPIRAFNISHNLLTDIDTLYRNDFVTHLDVSGNRLSRLVVRSNFRVVIANSNQISSLGWENVSSRWELLQLEVADNLLAEIDPRLFEARKLNAIDVSENRLNGFPFELVYRLKLLQTVSAARNNIRSVPEDITFSFKLDTLDLSENPLEEQERFLNSTLIGNLIVNIT